MATFLRELEKELAELRAAPRPSPRSAASAGQRHDSHRVGAGALGGGHRHARRPGERHPSRTILLFPRPDDSRDTLEARGRLPLLRARRPAARGLRGDLDHSLRPGSPLPPAWSCRCSSPTCRSLPALARAASFERAELEQLVGVADRLVVDSREWPETRADLAAPTALRPDRRLRHLLGSHRAVAGGRCRSLAGVAEASRLRVAGPEPEALLLQGWLAAARERSGSSASRPGRSSSSRWTAARRVPGDWAR